MADTDSNVDRTLADRVTALDLNLRWWQWGAVVGLGVIGGHGSFAELAGGVVGSAVLVWLIVMAVRAVSGRVRGGA